MQLHMIPPVYDSRSNILILGSFPSVKSRETGFYYGHPQNRFWRVLAALTGDAVPESIAERKRYLLRHGIALWDVVGSCEITGSSDASIRHVLPNDISPILNMAHIQQIFVNGKTAEALYQKWIEPMTGRAAVCLPSTSPANASWNLPRLLEAWGVIKTYLPQLD